MGTGVVGHSVVAPVAHGVSHGVVGHGLVGELPTVLLVTVSATASLEELPTELVLEECSTDTLATTELPSSTLLSPVEKNTTRHQEQIRIGYRLPKLNSNLISIFIY